MPRNLLPVVIEPLQLQPLLDDPRLLLVDLSELSNYQQHHLPGAVPLAFQSLIRAAPPAMGLIPSEAHLSRVLSDIGLRREHHVVAYDSEGNGRASRFLWTLDALGHQAYSLLDGGLAAWSKAGGRIDSGPLTATPSQYRASLDNPNAVADLDYISSRLSDPAVVILDTRSEGEYTGMDQRAARAGHIPGAINIEWTRLMDPQREHRLLPEAALRDLLEQHGVTPDKEVIVHCQTHHRSAHTYVALKHLGYQRLRGYAGSWSEWGNRDDTPIAR